MFNEYIWQTYLNAGGKEVIDVFKNLCEADYSPKLSEVYRKLIESLHTSYCAAKSGVEYSADVLKNLFDDLDYNRVAGECAQIIELPEEKLTLRQIIRNLYNGMKGNSDVMGKYFLLIFLIQLNTIRRFCFYGYQIYASPIISNITLMFLKKLPRNLK